MAICGPFFIVKVHGAVVKIYRYALCGITNDNLMSFTALWQRKCDLICVLTVLIKPSIRKQNRINK